MKKILIVSTVSRQFYLFEQGNIEVLKALGYKIHGAANFEDANERLNKIDIVRHPFDIQRSPFSFKNIKAYKQLKKIMKSENFDAVHCHSPMGGVLARLAARSIGLKNVIYTAHGFHFYKGAPVINWILYYPIEKWLSRYTDILITINKEDYSRALNFYAKKVVYIPGVGIDVDKFLKITDKENKIESLKKEYRIYDDQIIFLSVGELNKNKNHEIVIKAIASLKHLNIRYFICGIGNLDVHLKKLVREYGVEEKVVFLGFRNDVEKWLRIADVFVFPSFREGLSVSLMEAMATELPVICSEIRGNVDLIDEGQGGFLFNPNDLGELVNKILIFTENLDDLKEKMGQFNRRKVMRYNKYLIQKSMKAVYQNE
jgi:glycosyltransferase involved in cell wall biosynthesis